MAYESSLKAKWDTQNAFDSVRREATEKKSYEVVSNLILETKFSDAKIAQLAIVSIDFVQKVRTDLAKKKN
ncbi:hypothetical protein [Olivibacter domesticus]|uniref:Uncharacterized protein n=1 Tax=Olivibacter domesticus TaxID=407022 RepID=A0A1H7JWS1_OLID1|nr:hypothetical protein [Olivibacter domesticus]SEK78217.1 hypothetical protein SAMN05661044_01132 [Olivibacter domesticus]